VTAAAIEAMKPGSVIVDIAAERGGNCEGTVAGKTVDIGGVLLVGAENLPATAPQDASQMMGRNYANFILHIAKDGEINLDSDDPIVQGTLVARGGSVVNERVAALLAASAGGGSAKP
jgi:H+-translocating NAD(P) transhydrogenase subunit alpha